MTEPAVADGQSLWVLLSLLSPRRVVLAGPDGPVVRAALEWARHSPVTRLVRTAGADGVGPGDLLVCEHAQLLPRAAPESFTALIGAHQDDVALARERGWTAANGRIEGATLLSPDGASLALHSQLSAYARARLAMSEQLASLRDPTTSPLEGATPPSPARRPVTAAVAPVPTESDLVSIIVPIHNAGDELRRCLTSLARFTTWPAELLLIDDASTDPEIGELLAQASELTGVRVLSNVVNLGFTATVNRGLRATGGDAVVLNSDTEVGPRWLEHLVATARGTGVATVTPVSDNAGAFSVPAIGVPNATPLALDTAGVARLLAQASATPVVTPTGSGFCMYIARATVNALGLFDADEFPRGYGEENDFCMRALRAGYHHLVDGRTFVRHTRTASFGDERAQLARLGRRRIDARYPEYSELVREFVADPGLGALQGRVRDAYALARPPRPRILTVIHEGGGGAFTANVELVRALELEWDPLMLTSDRRTVRLWRCVDGALEQLREWTLERSIRVTDYSRHDYAQIVERVLIEHEVEVMHVRHLFKHTFDAPRIARRLGIPVVFSFHDFYFACPTFNLLDNQDRYCGGACTPGDGECRLPGAGLDGLPHLKHGYVYQWREEVESMLDGVDAFVTTSAHTREVHLRALGSLRGRPFELIEHGRSLRQRGGITAAPSPGGKIKILVVANLDVHKGAEYIRSLSAADAERRLEFHLLGGVPGRYADLGICHGAFDAEDLPRLAAEIGPAFAGCFSITPETYSHALTEAWAMGIPVLATDLGALRERIGDHGGGVLLPHDDPGAAVALIHAAADDAERYGRLRERATLRGCATVADMTDSYAALYRRVIDGRRAFVSAPGSAAAPQLARGVGKLLAVVPGADGVHPGSTYVRIVQRYRHPSVNPKISLCLRRADQDPLACDPDLALVQRTALDPLRAEEFVAALAARDTPLVLDLDDHLLLRAQDDADYAPHRESLECLLAAATLVLVSTEPLGEALRGLTGAIAVIPNLIDERLFLAGTDSRPRTHRRSQARGPAQAVYIASPTHGEDLAMLAPVFEQLAGAVELNVIGAERAAPGQEWYRRVTVPDDCKPYPRFVGWLREQRPFWDLAVAPLQDTLFNHYKSDLKYLEYAALGLPGVFSDRAAYATVEDGDTGLKVGDEAEDWIRAVTSLAESPADRDALAERAFREVTSGRLLRHGSEDLLRVLAPIMGA
jgi:GT2 family glycosyltransferase/glycosyltransferase involved in cell wall biosynthesis